MKEFARKCALALAGQLGQGGASLLLVVVTARLLSPQERGAFVLLALVCVLSAYVLAVGLPGAVLKEAAQAPDAIPRLLGAATLVSVGVAIVGGGLGIGLQVALDLPLWAAPFPFLASFATCWLIFASWLAFGVQRYLIGGLIRAIPTASAALGIALCAVLRPVSAATAYAIWVVAHLLVMVVCWRGFKRRYGVARPRGVDLARWSRFGLSFFGIQLTQLLTLRADQFLLGALASVAAVGTYSLAASLSEAVALCATAAGIVVFADAARGVADRARFLQQLSLLVGIGSIAAVGLGATASFFLARVFGPQYEPAIPMLQILLLGTPGLLVTRLVVSRLCGIDRPGAGTAAAAIGMAVTIALDLLLIPRFGGTGAAAASAVGYTTGAAAALLLLLRSRDETRALMPAPAGIGP